MLKFRATKYAITVCGLTSIALLFVFFFPPRNPHTETLKPALVEIQFHDITNLPQAKQKYPFSENGCCPYKDKPAHDQDTADLSHWNRSSGFRSVVQGASRMETSEQASGSVRSAERTYRKSALTGGTP